jgi:hypothetical protein
MAIDRSACSALGEANGSFQGGSDIQVTRVSLSPTTEVERDGRSTSFFSGRCYLEKIAASASD